MIALAQAGAGLALVAGLALLWISRAVPASVVLTVQSAAVALAVIATDRPLLAVPPVLLTGLAWLVRPHAPDLRPAGNMVIGLVTGAVLVVLCHADSVPGSALAIVLMAMLFAAMRRLWLIALIWLQNGIILLASTAAPPLLLPAACLILPLPLAAGAMIGRQGLAGARWAGWVALALTGGMLTATLAAALDPVASVFAPLLVSGGMLRAWQARQRRWVPRHATRLLRLGFSVLAVCAPTPDAAWLAMIAAIGCGSFPRFGDTMGLALIGVGLALLGLTMPPDALIGDLGRLVGSVLVAGCVPDLAIPVVILLLRHTAAVPLTDEAATLLMGVASAAVLGWVGLSRRRNLGFAAIAALSLGLGQPDGRFAAIVLLVLLILTEASLPAVAAAELVLLPGVALAALAVSFHHPWLLVPVGIGLIPALLRLSGPWRVPRPASWLPLGLGVLFGWFTPAPLVALLQAVAAGGR